MRVLLHRLGVTLREEHMGDHVDGAAVAGARTVVLNPSGYAPRDEFTLAHELLELHIPGSWRREMPKETKERLCDRGASALLLPAAAFRASVDELGLDLAALRRHWRNASWDVLARRLVDVGAARSAAAWDSFEPAWRYGGEAHPHEEEALGRAMAAGRSRVGRVRAWRIAGEGLGRVAVVAA